MRKFAFIVIFAACVPLKIAFAQSKTDLTAYSCKRSFAVHAATGSDSQYQDYFRFPSSPAGDANHPFASIERALEVEVDQPYQYSVNHSITGAGICINVNPGRYSQYFSTFINTRGGNADKAEGYLVVRRTPGKAGTVEIVDESSSASGSIVTLGGSYTILSYLVIHQLNPVLEANHCVAVTGSFIKILNSVIYDCGGSGIATTSGDYFFIYHNIVYNTSSSDTFQTSGIGIYHEMAFDLRPGWTDKRFLGSYHAIILNNTSYDNFTIFSCTDQQNPYCHTDGNGIIIDSNDEQGCAPYPSCTTPFNGSVLIANNIVYGNGGSGIRVDWSDNVTMDGNTAFGNSLDTFNQGSYKGEMIAQGGNNLMFSNNVAYSVPVATPAFGGAGGCTESAPCYWNTAFAAYGDQITYNNPSVSFQHNVAFNSQPNLDMQPQISCAFVSAGICPSGISIVANNLFDPLFSGTGQGDFHVRTGSPAIGLASGLLVTADHDNIIRGSSAVTGALATVR